MSQEQLKDLADIRQGHSTRKAVKSARDGTHHILQMRDFDDTRTTINANAMIRFSPGPVTPENELRPGDVIFLAKGSRNFAFAPSGLPPHTLAANYFFIIRPSGEALPEYIVWYLNRSQTRRHLARFSGGGVHMPVIRKGVLASLELPLPPTSVQKAIVELDALLQHEQALHSELASKRRTLCDAVCISAARQLRKQESPQ